jgi:hypothetical protein
MNPSKEQSLLSELKQICSRLGDVVDGIDVDPGGCKEKIDGICADLVELRDRVGDPAPANT